MRIFGHIPSNSQVSALPSPVRPSHRLETRALKTQSTRNPAQGYGFPIRRSPAASRQFVYTIRSHEQKISRPLPDTRIIQLVFTPSGAHLLASSVKKSRHRCTGTKFERARVFVGISVPHSMATAVATVGGVAVVQERGLRERGAMQSAPAAVSVGLGFLVSTYRGSEAGQRNQGWRIAPVRKFLETRRNVNVSATLAVASVVQDEGEKEKTDVPLPVVHIDQFSDPEATIVELSFGDRLGALLDTIKSLKSLGLNVMRAKVSTESAMARNIFYITRLDNGCKVENPELLEAIRLTILNNLLKYHPESSEQLALGETFGIVPPKTKLDVDVATHIHIEKINSKQSLLTVESADRPGLLLEIIKVIADISVMVESAEIDTEGLVAKDKFYVSYGGAALSKSMCEVLINCLRYYIRRPVTEDDSY